MCPFSDDDLVACTSGGQATVLRKVDYSGSLELSRTFVPFTFRSLLPVLLAGLESGCDKNRCRSMLRPVTRRCSIFALGRDVPSLSLLCLLALQSFPGIPKTVLELAKTTSDSCRPTSSTTRLNTLDAGIQRRDS